MGWPKERRPTSAQARPKADGAARAGLPPEPQRLTRRTRLSARQTGEAEEDDGGTRRRWLLRRDQRRYCVRLTHAHLEEPSIEAIVAGKSNGDSHGGARPWLDRLRQGYDVMALVAHSTSFRVPPRG